MSSASTFVSVPADRMVGCLESIGASIEKVGGSFEWSCVGRERLFILRLHDQRVGAVAIYTSLPLRGSHARGCGQDAIRFIVGAVDDKGKFRPVAGRFKKTMHRTAPRAAEDRVQVLLDRLTGYAREAYKDASKVRRCVACGAAMSPRKARSGHEFLGCMRYPECKHTESL